MFKCWAFISYLPYIHSLKTSLNPAVLFACSFQVCNVLWVTQDLCPLYSNLKPAAGAIFAFLRHCDVHAVIFFFFFSPPLCAISWPKEKYFTGVVSGAEYEVHFKFPFVFLCIFFYYCRPTNRVKGFILVKGSDLAGMKLPHRHFSISLWCQPWYTALKSRGELFFSWLSCTEKQSHHHTSYRDLLALDQAGIHTKS